MGSFFSSQIHINDLLVDVERKDIRHMHLRVLPPKGRIRLSAPQNMPLETLRDFVASKVPWILKHQARLRNQPQTPKLEFQTHETHWLWGKPYGLTVIEKKVKPTVFLNPDGISLSVQPNNSLFQRFTIMECWYRQQVAKAVPPLLEKWQAIVGVRVKKFYVRRMKTRWGSCSYKAQTIRLNTELARTPKECLEYVLVHELVHLLEPRHNTRFYAFLDHFLPRWKDIQGILKTSPMPDIPKK